MEQNNRPHSDTPDQLLEIARAFFARWALPVQLNHLRIEYSYRMTASLARTYPRKTLIRLSSLLMCEYDDLLPQIICHEVAHLAVYLMHGSDARPHGPEWARLVAEAGFSPHRRLALPSNSRQTGQEWGATCTNYLHRCLVCQSIRKSKRRIPNWRCQRCLDAGLSGEIAIEKIAI